MLQASPARLQAKRSLWASSPSPSPLRSPCILAVQNRICRPCVAAKRHISCYPPTDYSLMTTIRFASTHRRKPFVPDTPVRTRFAPSPTGYLHLGSLRTALFNYLLAKRTGGQFLLRIEDTDQNRTIPDAEQRLMDDLRWAGLEWDEGPEVGGPYGPYRQSDRTSLYHAHADQLLASGHAYRCFCSPERLYQLAETRHKLGLPTDYDRHCFHLSAEESAERAHAGVKHVIRLKAPKEYPSFEDLVYGTVGKKPHQGGLKLTREQRFPGLDAFEDPILLKSDGQPTYHFANVVDDHHMKVTHVIRGTEWLIATPKHIALYDALGWHPPEFAHVGLLVDEEGNKLSKRNLDDIGISNFRDRQGVLPEALVNYVALMGWSHDKRKDLFDMEELCENFTLKFTKGNTILDTSKLWYLQPRHAAARASKGGPPFQELVEKVSKVVRDRYSEESYRSIIGSRSLEAYVSGLLKADANNYLSAPLFVDRNQFFFSPESYPPLEETVSSNSASPASSIPQDFLFAAAERILAIGEDAGTDDSGTTAPAPWNSENIQSKIGEESKALLKAVNSPPPSETCTSALTSEAGANAATASVATLVPNPSTTAPASPIAPRQVNAELYHFLRAVFFGGQDGPPVAQSMALVGRQFCRRRLDAAAELRQAGPPRPDSGLA